MAETLNQRLSQILRVFSTQPGNVAVILQSKRDPELLVTINSDMELPSASIIKAAIACAVADQSEIELSQKIDISSLDPTFYCSIMQAFDPGDQISLKAMIGLMLIVSDNPATTAVLDVIGIDKVNAWLAKNGLNQTNLEIGFDDNALGQPLRANLTTARDCLRLLQLIDSQPNFAFIKHMLANNLRNERIPKLLPDDAVIAHKTGTLNGLVHDIAIIESPSAAYYLVALADGLLDEPAFVGSLVSLSSEIYELMSA